MRKCIVFLAAALLAAESHQAKAIDFLPATNQVVLSWDSLGEGTEYSLRTSTNLVNWVTATNTTATSVSFEVVPGSTPIFSLAASNAPAQSVTLAWDPSSTESQVAGYWVYYGGSHRNYTNRVDAGLNTSGVISNLTAGTVYFFAVTAYSTDGLESDYSDEAVWNGALRLRIGKSP